MISSYFTNKWLEHQVGTRRYIRRRSHSNPMNIPSDHHFCWLYILYIYILTHYVILFWIIHCVILFRYQYQPQWKPLLNLHFPRCSYGFSHCFADFFPIRSAIPGRLFIPRGAASLRPGTAVCGPRWGSGWVLDGSMGFHQQLNGDFLWNVSPENEWWSWWDVMSTLDFSKPRLRLFKKGRVPFI